MASIDQAAFFQAMYETIAPPADSPALATLTDTPFLPTTTPQPFRDVDLNSLEMPEIVPGVASQVPKVTEEQPLPAPGAFLGLRTVDLTEAVRDRTLLSSKQLTGNNAAILPGFAQGEIMVKREDKQRSLLSRPPVVGLEHRQNIVDLGGAPAALNQRPSGAHNYRLQGELTVLPERADGAVNEARAPGRAGVRTVRRDPVREADGDPAAYLRNTRHMVPAWEAAAPNIYTTMHRHEIGGDQDPLGHRPAREPVLDGAHGRQQVAGKGGYSVAAEVINYERGLRSHEARVPGSTQVYGILGHARQEGAEARKQAGKAERGVYVDPPEGVGNGNVTRQDRVSRHALELSGAVGDYIERRDVEVRQGLLSPPQDLSVLAAAVAQVLEGNPYHIAL